MTKLLIFSVLAMMVNIVSTGWSKETNRMSKGFGLSIATDKAIYHPEEPITITLIIFNHPEDPLTFTFNSTQRYEFFIRREEKEIWRWSAERVFAGVMGEEKIQPGGSLIYTETYRPQAKLMPGVYSVTGMLTSKDPPEALKGTVCIQIR